MQPDLEHLKTLALAATRGKWQAYQGTVFVYESARSNIGLIQSVMQAPIFLAKDMQHADAAFVAAAHPGVVFTLADRLEHAIVQVRELRGERDAAVLERNAAMGRAVKAEQQLSRPPMLKVPALSDDELAKLMKDFKPGPLQLVRNDRLEQAWSALTKIERYDCETQGGCDSPMGVMDACSTGEYVRFEDVERLLNPMPDDPLDDVLPLPARVLPANLPASLDLPDTEGGSHD